MKCKVTVSVEAVGEIAWDNEELHGMIDVPDEMLEADIIEDIVEQIYSYIDITVEPRTD